MPDLTVSAAIDTFMGSADQPAMRTNIGGGTMMTQAASAVAITGGTINGTAIGGTTPAAAAVTTLSLAGHQTFATDNLYDIGAAGANRPRDMYVGTSINAGGPVVSIQYFQAHAAAIGLYFGDGNASNPCLKRSSTELHVRLGNDSAFAPLVFLLPTSNPGPGTLWNNGGTLTVGT